MRSRMSKNQVRPAIYGLMLLAGALLFAGCFPSLHETPYTVSWSPDGTRAAIVPDPENESIRDSGLWIYDTTTGRTRNIFKVDEDTFCYYPQWSPFGREILFCQIPRKGIEGADKPKPFPATIWIINPDSGEARRVGETEFLMPSVTLNALAWGPLPNTILYQKAIDDQRLTVLEMELTTGKIWSFLPGEVNAYALVPSPSREKVAAMLFGSDDDEQAELVVTDFSFQNWQSLGTIHPSVEGFELSLPMIYWSPDSSRFVIIETEKGRDSKSPDEPYLRLYDVHSGQSRRIAAGAPNASILWNEDGTELLFSSTEGQEEKSAGSIRRVRVSSGEALEIARGSELHLLAWNHADGRIYFSESIVCPRGDSTNDKDRAHRFFSCLMTGEDVRELDWSFVENSFGWSTSPNGTHILFNRDPLPLSSLDVSGAPKVRFLSFAKEN